MRCDFSIEKNGLIRAYAIYKAYGNDEQKFKEELNKAFNNPEDAIEAINNMLEGGGETPSSTPSGVINLDLVGNTIDDDSDLENIQAFFLDSSNFIKMQNSFRKELLKAAILDIDTMTYIDPEAKVGGDLTAIQNNIILYKNKLLLTIAKAIGKEGVFTPISSSTSYTDYTNIVNGMLQEFDSYRSLNNVEESDAAYHAFVILKNFDNLVSKYAPYVKIDDSYNNKYEGVKKYSFSPTVKHRNHFAKTDHSDITKQIGNLPETLLRVIPDVDSNGNALSSTIGVSGFNGAMQLLKNGIMYNNMFGQDESAEIRKAIASGAEVLLDSNNPYNLAKIIDAFIEKQSQMPTSGEYSAYRQTYILNKLRSIRNNLLSDNVPNYIKSIFCQLFLKTEECGYRVYGYDWDTRSFDGKNLKAKASSMQQYAFESVISGGLKSIDSETKITANNILNQFDITITAESNGREITTIKSKSSNREIKISNAGGKIEIITESAEDYSGQVVSEFMKAVFSYYIPDTYDKCIASPKNYKWQNDFAPFIAIASKLALQRVHGKTFGHVYYNLNVNGRGKVDLSEHRQLLRKIGSRLSVIFGDSIRSTTKSLSGNSLPLFGQTSLQYNWRTCLDKVHELSDKPYNMQQYGLFYGNDQLLLAPQIRSEIELNGQVKDSTKLNVNELLRVGILDDFWFPSRETASEDNAIWFQNATDSDKGRHFIMGYRLNHILINDHIKEVYGDKADNYKLSDIINDIIANGDSKAIEFIRLIRRDKYTTAALKILYDYSEVYPEWVSKQTLEDIENKNTGDERALACVEALKNLNQKMVDSKVKLPQIIKRFNDYNKNEANAKNDVVFRKETHATVPGDKRLGNVNVNETMLAYLTASASKNAWSSMINRNKQKFADNLRSLVIGGLGRGSDAQTRRILDDSKLTARLGKKHPEFFDITRKEYKLVTNGGKLHPIAEAYFAMDILLSGEYNSLTIGEIWAHQNKNKEGVGESTQPTLNQYGLPLITKPLSIQPFNQIDGKAAVKGSLANKFIGIGVSGSATESYALQVGVDKANLNQYSPNDVVFVSINGKRGSVEERTEVQNKTIEKALLALKSGATLLTDTIGYARAKDYNEGERLLHSYLRAVGAKYSEIVKDGETIGVWRAGNEPVEIQSDQNGTFMKAPNGEPTKLKEYIVEYTPVGKSKQSYTVRKNDDNTWSIYNKKGEEVFKDDTKDRRKIFAEIRYNEDAAVKIEYKGKTYIVDDYCRILNKDGDFIYTNKNDNNGDRLAIEKLAKDKFAAISQQNQSNSTTKSNPDALPADFVKKARELYNNIKVEKPTEPIKTSNNIDRYLEYSEANRLVNQVKRSVIFGSTIHPFGIGVKNERGRFNGVASEIDIAIIDDMKGKVFTILGVDDTIDSQDGSGFCTALQARLENNSEADAAVGDNKKTIIHDIDPTTGTPTLLKWAVYALTNNVRRNGAGSNANVENLVRRMYSKNFGNINAIIKELNSKDQTTRTISQIYRDYMTKNGPIYVKNRKTGEYEKVKGIKINSDGTYSRYGTIENFVKDSTGKLKREVKTFESPGIKIETLYDIDQLFGGAWTFTKKQKDSGSVYVGTEASVDLLSEVAIEYDLRDKQVAYAVNSSACKVGAANINDSDTWTNDNDLSTYKISMRFGGVMMNADHELEEAEVTEMSQMISALIEDGHYTDLVTKIYSEIGQIALNNSKVKKIIQTIDAGGENMREKLATIMGESLIRSFSTGTKDTIGLAQAFIKKAARELKQNSSANYNLPFDDATIWGAVIADTISAINKAGIRRKYEGFAGVLNPSHNMTQYYITPVGDTMMFNQFEDKCRKVFKSLGEGARVFDRNGNDISDSLPIDKAKYGYEIIFQNGKKILNPFLQEVGSSYDIDFEDTIVIKKADGTFETIYIDDFREYDFYRNIFKLPKGWTIYKNYAYGRNLRGTDTTFNVKTSEGINVGKFSLYDIDSVRAAHYINELKIDPLDVDAQIAEMEQIAWDKQFDLTKEEEIRYSQLFLIQKVYNILKEKGYTQDVDGCNVLTQEFLQKLDRGKGLSEISNGDPAAFGEQECFKNAINLNPNVPHIFFASSYETRPAEIIMGRYQMEKLGLDISDNLSEIKDDSFFLNKLKRKYNLNKPKVSTRNNTLKKEEYDAIYDRILYINGEPVLVKVGKLDADIRNKLIIGKDNYIEIVGDDVRSQNKVIVDSKDGYCFETIKTNKGFIKYITIDNGDPKLNEKALDKLSDSEFFDDLYRDAQENKFSFEARLNRMAKDRFQSFRHALEFVGARIPTQAMQSFMPFKVIAFNDSEQNAVYVPKANTHIEGSDYDIDKLYLLTSTIMKNGKLQSGSSLQNRIGYDAAIKLERPNGIEYTEGPGGYVVTTSDLAHIGKLETDEQINYLVNLFNKILKTSESQITFFNDISLDEKECDKQIQKFLKLLNKHSLTPSYIRDSEEALKSRVFAGIYQITRAAQNQIKSQITVDTCTAELKAKAAQTTAGNAEKHITPYDPSSKFVMQVQNMLGKAVVGIGAVSLKTYFILSTSYNRKCDTIAQAIANDNFKEAYELIESLVIKRPSLTSNSGFEDTTLANINLDEILEQLQIKINQYEINNIHLSNSIRQMRDRVLELKENTSKISAPEFLSGIISLAADNAKDLALPKLNATEDLVDIYTTAAMIGIPFSEISDIMTSDIFTWLTKAGENNIFDIRTQNHKVKNMVRAALFKDLYGDKKKLIESIFNRYNDYIKSHNLDQRLYAKWSDKHNKPGEPPAIEQTLSNPAIINSIIAYITEPKTGLLATAPRSHNSIQSEEDVDYFADYDVEEGVEVNATKGGLLKQDVYEALLIFEFYRQRLAYVNPDGEKKLRYLDTLLDYVEEMSTLGRQASINQGMKTNIRDFYNSTRNIKDMINRRYKRLLKDLEKTLEKTSENNKDYATLSSKVKKMKTMGPFDFKRYLKDDGYAKEYIAFAKEFELLKGFNILEALRNAPNFFAMSRLQPYADEMLRTVLQSYNFATSVADKLIDNEVVYNLSENDFRALTDYFTDFSIADFLANSGIVIDIAALKVECNSDISVYESSGFASKVSSGTITLDSAQSVASFKHLMEENIIPALKAKYPNNKFLQDLARKDNSKLGSETYALPLQMMNIDSDEGTQELYMAYLRDFNEIASQDFNGLIQTGEKGSENLKIGDLFFLYNLIVNKNGFGQQSLTRIFEDVINNSKNCPKTIMAYYDSLSKGKSPDFKEAVCYIIRKSKGSKITIDKYDKAFYSKDEREMGMSIGNVAIKPETLPSDYTLYLPRTYHLQMESISRSATKNRTKRELVRNLNVNSAIYTLCNTLNAKAGKTIVHAVSKDELGGYGVQGNPSGFVYKGGVYLNVSYFNDMGSAFSVAMHEIAHLILASMKFTNSTRYYSLLKTIQNDPEYNRIAQLYPDSVGSDLDEEVFCVRIKEILAGYFSGGEDSLSVELTRNNEFLESSLQTIFGGITIEDAVDQNLGQVITTFIPESFSVLGSIELEYVKNNQRIAKLKQLFLNSNDANNKLDQRCY